MSTGVEAVVVRTPFEDFTVKVRRGGARLDSTQLADAEWAARELRFGIEMGNPEVTRAARELVRLLDGESVGRSGIGFIASDVREPHPTAFGGLTARLQQELLAGRLLVERRKVRPLGERREFELPELPSPPPAPPESSAHTFEVRFVDEVGQAISGIDAEFRADDTQTRRTNAAGIALLDDVQSSNASVSVPDAKSLSSVLDPRWQSFRPGKAPKESNLQEVVFFGEELGPFDLKAEVPNTVVVKPPLGKLFVELWDKSGRARHADCSYQITGPQSFEGTTDADGRLLHESVFPGDYQLSLALDFFEEDAPDRALDIVESPLVVLAPGEGRPLVRELGAVPRSVLARLRMHFNTNKSFLLPTALPSMLELRRIYLDNAPCELLVVGHADTAGDASYNDELSLERAEATIAYLKDDVDAWLEHYGQSVPAKRRWGTVEDRLMLSALPDFVSKPAREPGLSWFQRTRELDGDGKADAATRRALIGEYMALDGVSLAEFVGEISATAHGCGENFPLNDAGDDLDSKPRDEQRDAVDRRVELFFFDREFGITPPPPGRNSKAGSTAYPLWRQRVVETIELRPSAGKAPKVQFVELADAHFRSDSAVVLPEGEAPDERGQHSAFTAAGFIATVLRVNQERPGRGLLVSGHTDTAASDTHNDELSRLRAKVALALLEGDRDEFRTLADQRHKPADINQILSWAAKTFRDLGFDCDPGKIGDDVDGRAVRRFQAAFNRNKAALGSNAEDLTVDGDAGPLTWGAFFDCYELDLQRELGEDAAGVANLRAALRFVDDERKSLGFGERFPIEELGVDDFRSQTNRRVEVLFFNPGEEPDLAHAEADPETSEIYLPGHYSREALPPRKTARVVTISLVVASLQSFRITQAPFTIRTDSGATVTGQTDADGLVTAKLPADTGEFLLTVQDPEPLPEFQTAFEQRYQLGTLAPPTTARGAIQRLRMLGLWTGPELAIFTEGTTDALRYFQILVDLPPSGQLDDATAANLDQVAFESAGASS